MIRFRQLHNNGTSRVPDRGVLKTAAFRMRRLVLAAFVLGILSILTAGAGSRMAHADMAALESSSTVFVKELADDALSALTNPDTPRDERVERFRKLFSERFAISTIGRFVLGRHWKNASKEEQDEYLGLFETLMVQKYVDRFEQYSGETLEILRAVADKETRATVQTRLIRPDASKPAVRMDWLIGTKEDVMKVVDVSVEGASMAQTLRADFASIIRQKGAGVSGLIETLKEKLKSTAAS